MAILQIHVDGDTMERLKVASLVLGRDVSDLTESAMSEGVIQSVPCLNGRPVDKRFDDGWDAIS